MKWTKFLWMAVLGMGVAMSSCSNDDNIGLEPGGGSGVEGDAYIAVKLQMPNLTRSARAVEDGSPAEDEVKTVEIAFFGKENAAVLQKLVKLDPTDVTAKKTTIKLKKSDYDVVFLVNRPTSHLVMQELVTTKASFEAASADLIAEDLKEDGFFMTNASGYKRVGSNDFKATSDEASAAGVGINVERALAKIIVDVASNIELSGGSVATVDPYLWAANVKNKQTFWMRVAADKIKSDGSGEIDTNPEDEGDYTNAGRSFLYAIDPNNTADEIEALSSAALFDRVVATDIKNEPSGSSNPEYDGKVEYVLENTMMAAGQYQPVTTSVMLQVKYFPRNISNVDKGYYTYNGMAISYSEMQTYAAGGATPHYGLEDLLIEYKALNEFDLTKPIGEADAPTESFSHSHAAHGLLSFYYEGVSYYNVPIRHFDNTLQPHLMGYGRYGVVRNNIYKLIINSITSPGTIEPEVPVDPDDVEAWIGFSFSITPWYVRSQGVDL